MNKIIALTGVARAGKDSACAFLSKYYNVRRFAFADKLKEAVRPLCKQYFRIDSFTTITEEKAIIRDFLVAFGNTARKQDHRIWIKAIDDDIKRCFANGGDKVIVVTDMRFDEHEDDEFNYVKNELSGLVINIERILEDGSVLLPANNSEATNAPRIKSKADICIAARNLTELEEEIKNNVLSIV